MTPKQRIEAVYKGETPDVVPYMLDLSHWFYHRHHRPWDLSRTYEEPESELIDYHKKMGVGFYVPNLGRFFETRYPDDVTAGMHKSEDGKTIRWSLETPLGKIERTRIGQRGTVTYLSMAHDREIGDCPPFRPFRRLHEAGKFVGSPGGTIVISQGRKPLEHRACNG